MGGHDKRWTDDNEPPFTDELPDAQTTTPGKTRLPITEGPCQPSYPAVIPPPQNQGKKPGWGWGM